MLSIEQQIKEALRKNDCLTILSLIDQVNTMLPSSFFEPNVDNPLSSAVIQKEAPEFIPIIKLYPAIANTFKDFQESNKINATKLFSLDMLSALFIALNVPEIKFTKTIYDPYFLGLHAKSGFIFWQNFLAHLPVAQRLRRFNEQYHFHPSLIIAGMTYKHPYDISFIEAFCKEVKEKAPIFYQYMLSEEELNQLIISEQENHETTQQ